MDGSTEETRDSEHLHQFDACRGYLLALAQRMLGSPAAAEDILQDAFLRWRRVDLSTVRSPRPYLVAIVTRLCINCLDEAYVRRRDSAEPEEALANEHVGSGSTPYDQVEMADLLSRAFALVLGRLAPTERAVFLLREVFELDFDEVAQIVEKTPQNCRQILSRARDRITGDRARFEVTNEMNARAVREFMRAVQGGSSEQLMNLLLEDAVLVQGARDERSRPPTPIVGRANVIASLLNETLWSSLEAESVAPARPFARPDAYVFSATTGKGAVVVALKHEQVASVEVVVCPLRLRELELLFGLEGRHLREAG